MTQNRMTQDRRSPLGDVVVTGLGATTPLGGDIALLVGFGAGLSYAAQVVVLP